MFRRLTYVVLGLLAMTAIPSESHAVEYHFSGQACRKALGSFPTASGSPLYTTPIFCPVGGIESSTVDVNNFKVHYTRPNTSTTITCKMHVRSGPSSILISSGTITTGSTGLVGNLTLTNPVNSGAAFFSGSTYVIECSASANGAYIRSYSVDQVNK